ncbi:ketosteroid isomerase-related protein [Pseudoroseicyclus tamaricis]|uniref:Isopropylmalate/homocitrate/citramalate synthase n=1 Tax=Pseudoroseicyclus tamaricis TaxID=2705421 RepID=A0A6B2JTX4_9RHOB|nr:ketosteroid isomerase-related protein [Pseudoroseicyclus tamaricis]NDV01738.1 isopropylmalate/homocitrate/citramalate synthase [Pseudoroseicyclus tamaricis]
MRDETEALIAAYYEAFNAKDTDAMLALLSEDVAHHVNEGQVRQGRELFAEFNAHMSRSYDERLTEMVIFASADGTRAAAEFMVNGTYLQTDPGLPEANGQGYRLPGGAFFTVAEGRIARVTTYYNLADWVAQVSA